MPKPRKAVTAKRCSFCGNDAGDVPLIITAPLPPVGEPPENPPACCCICALGIVQQTFLRYGELDKQIREQMMKTKHPAPRPQIVTTDGVKEAVNAVSEGDKNGKGG